MSRINPEMPLYIRLPNGRIDDLPDYYEVVERRERTGYSSHGVPQNTNIKYAVRPLTALEMELLDGRGGGK